MSRGYSYSLIVIVGWLIAVKWLAEQVIPNEARAQGQEQQDQAKAKEPSIPVRIIEQPAQSEADKRSQEESNQREIEDLVAQQGMADGTQDIVWLSKLQLAIALAGTLALLYSIGLNRRATNAAVNGNALALQAIKQEQTNAQKTLRAYVGVDSVKIFYSLNNIATTRITLKNTGQTPARDVLAVIHNDILELPAEEASFPIDFTLAKSKTSIERDGHTKLELPTIDKVDEFTMTKMQVDRTTIFVWGEVRYKDVFGDEWVTHYRFQSDPMGHKEHKTDGIICGAGNEAT